MDIELPRHRRTQQSRGISSRPGYIDPGEAADEILDDALQPFLDDLARRATLGFASAATPDRDRCPLWTLCLPGGRLRDAHGVHPDYVVERAATLIDKCSKLAVALPVNDLLDRVPESVRTRRTGP
jgi:hypothetical protein